MSVLKELITYLCYCIFITNQKYRLLCKGVHFRGVSIKRGFTTTTTNCNNTTTNTVSTTIAITTPTVHYQGRDFATYPSSKICNTVPPKFSSMFFGTSTF